MSDQFDALFDGLRGQRPPAPFAPAPAVRRRGRQRAHRQAVSIGVAVFAVTGLGAGGIVATLGESDPPVPPASPPATTAPPSESPQVTESPDATEGPAPTAVPAQWLLTPGDLPSSGWEEDTGELISGAWYGDGAEPWCPEYRLEDFPSAGSQVDLTTRGWLRNGEAVPERVDQLVEIYEPGTGTAALDDVRAFIDLCSRRPEEGDQVAPTYYEIVENDFAGDESMLIRVEQYQFGEGDEIEPAGEPLYVAVVRVGDAVTTIQYLNLPDAAVPVAERAAELLGQ